MKKNFFIQFVLIFIFLTSCLSTSFSQIIKGKINDPSLLNKWLYLSETIGNTNTRIDSVKITSKGKFTFPPRKYPSGYYLLSVSDTNKAAIILNSSERLLEVVFSEATLQNGITIIASNENKILWEYKNISRKVQEELGNRLIKNPSIPHPKNAKDSAALAGFLNTRDSLDIFKKRQLTHLSEKNPDSYFAKASRAALRKTYSDKAQAKTHFFDVIDFSDSSLVRSAVFPIAIFDYLQLYTEHYDDGFKSSIDTILKRTSANNTVHDFCLNFLLEVFDKTGPELIFQHIVEKYLVGDGCANEQSKPGINDIYKNKAGEYRLLLPGNIAPDVSLPDSLGKQTEIRKIAEKNKTTVLFFWSSHCDFCHKVIPDLQRIYSLHKQGELEIIAISLDDAKNDWLKYINDHKLTWVNLCEFKGWKSIAAEKYKIHKTPSFYVLDNKMTILAKPQTTANLESIITERSLHAH